MDEFTVINVRPAYVYFDKEQDRHLETHLNQLFISDSYADAVDQGVAWARNRFENVIKDFYEQSVLGSIKISEKIIARPDTNGFIDTRSSFCFFEWKYDWPGTLEGYVRSFKRRESSKLNLNEGLKHG